MKIGYPSLDAGPTKGKISSFLQTGWRMAVLAGCPAPRMDDLNDCWGRERLLRVHTETNNDLFSWLEIIIYVHIQLFFVPSRGPCGHHSKVDLWTGSMGLVNICFC